LAEASGQQHSTGSGEGKTGFLAPTLPHNALHGREGVEKHISHLKTVPSIVEPASGVYHLLWPRSTALFNTLMGVAFAWLETPDYNVDAILHGAVAYWRMAERGGWHFARVDRDGASVS
jgi:hypothetical protein